MRNPHPFNCDICSQPKQPSNNWMLGMTGNYAHRAIEKSSLLPCVTVSSWDDGLAAEENVAHLCGIECAAKWSTKKFDELRK